MAGLIEFFCAATVFFCAGLAFGIGVYFRLMARLHQAEEAERLARDLEKRRLAYYSDRDVEPRPAAGPNAKLGNLFPPKKREKS